MFEKPFLSNEGCVICVTVCVASDRNGTGKYLIASLNQSEN